jgi:Putative phage serine protease XkdF
MPLIAENNELWKYSGSDDLGLVFGWAIVCNGDDGEPYFDLHGDHIPENAMMKASLEFALSDRVGKVMHDGEQVGTHAFIMPVTKEMIEANGWATKKTGLLLAWKPDSPEIIAAVKSGKLTGFSIGGAYGETEELPDA